MKYKIYQLKRVFDNEEDALEYKKTAEDATRTSHVMVVE